MGVEFLQICLEVDTGHGPLRPILDVQTVCRERNVSVDLARDSQGGKTRTAVELPSLAVGPVGARSSGLAGHGLALPRARLVGTNLLAIVVDVPPVVVGDPDSSAVLGPGGRICASGKVQSGGEKGCGELHLDNGRKLVVK